MDPNNEREPEEVVPQEIDEAEDENAEGDGQIDDRGDGVHLERADDQGHGDTGSPSTAWNDPPPVAPRPPSAVPRRNLTRRVPFLGATAAQGPPAGSSAAPVGFTEADTHLMEIISTLNSLLGNSCLVRQMGKFQEYWVSAVCTVEMKDEVLKMTRHIREGQYREAELLHAILALNPSAGWFTLYFRQIINLLRDGISAEPNKDILEQ